MKIEKVVVITLDMSAKYKKEKTKIIFDNLGDIELQFVKGVLYKDTTDFKPYPGWKIKSDNDWYSRHILEGEMGCAAAHYNTWAINTGFSGNILFFEQDFHIDINPSDYIDSVEFDFDILYLGCNPINNNGLLNSSTAIAGYTYNSHAYILSPAGLTKLISNFDEDNVIPVDEYMSALITPHPRTDIRAIYKPSTLAYYSLIQYISQRNNKSVIESTKEITNMKEDIKKMAYVVWIGSDIQREAKRIEMNDQLNKNNFDFSIYDTLPYYTNKMFIEDYTNDVEDFSDCLFILIAQKTYLSFSSKNITKEGLLKVITNPIEQLYSGNNEVPQTKFLSNAIQTKNWELVVRDLGDEVYTVNAIKPDWCSELIELADKENRWTENRHDFYPTQDILLSDLDSSIFKAYDNMLREYIMPMANHIWQTEGKAWQPANMTHETFLIRYDLDKQSYLDLHHDHADYTALLTLNTDFEGGGTYFNRQKKLVKADNPGIMTIHPATLTHKHGGVPIENGNRYIMVSFIKRRE